jgi:gamma-glutamyl-gamma-aminobutyrate hydrolase PuuD
MLTLGSETRRVQLHLDHGIEFPELWMDIHIHGPAWEERLFAEMFARARCRKALSPEEADVVVFTGGPDVDPILYGETRHHSTHTDPARDASDMAMYKLCYEKGIPMFGVCRGMQFLHVMNGGKLYQDVDGHTGDHPCWDAVRCVMIPKVSSVHHQMCIVEEGKPGPLVLLESSRAKIRRLNATENMMGVSQDCEAFWYRDTVCLGVQGHPEYRGYHQFAKWCFDRIHDYIAVNPDLVWVGSQRRLDPALMAQRKLGWTDKSPPVKDFIAAKDAE